MNFIPSSCHLVTVIDFLLIGQENIWEVTILMVRDIHPELDNPGLKSINDSLRIQTSVRDKSYGCPGTKFFGVDVLCSGTARIEYHPIGPLKNKNLVPLLLSRIQVYQIRNDPSSVVNQVFYR